MRPILARTFFCLTLFLGGCISKTVSVAIPINCWSEVRWDSYYQAVPASHFPVGWEVRFPDAKSAIFLEGKTEFFRPADTKLKFSCQWQENKEKFFPGETGEVPKTLRSLALESWSRGNAQSRWFVKIRMGKGDQKDTAAYLYCRGDKETIEQNFHVANVLKAISASMKKWNGELCVPEDPGYRNPIY